MIGAVVFPATRHGAMFLMICGLVALILPTIITLVGHNLAATGDPQSLVVLSGAVVLLARKWQALRCCVRPPPRQALRLAALMVLMCYVFGRAYDVLAVEVVALIGLLYCLFIERFGVVGIRIAWFPVGFMMFIIPIPGAVLSIITGPLKVAISRLATALLRAFDYPVARSGVTLYVAQHQLLVEDACAGLNTVVSLVALCCCYIYLARPSDVVALVLMVIPVALLANFVRVLLLILITYHFDNEIAQSYLHQLAGVIMLMIALAVLMAGDRVLRMGRTLWR